MLRTTALILIIYILVTDNIFAATPHDHNLEKCINETKAKRHSVKRLKSGYWVTTDVTLKKWALCYLVSNGVMSKSGVLRQDVVLKDIPDKDKGNVENVIKKCLYNQAHDPVDTAWHYLTCFRKHSPKYAKLANHI